MASQEATKTSEWARDWDFGDARFDTHSFVETAAKRTPKELGCAFAASFLVSPMVSIIDKAIVHSGKMGLRNAMSSQAREMFCSPKTFFGGLSFRLTFAVYFGTYAVANMSELILDVSKIRNDDERKTYKVSAASVANVSLLMWRDAVFAREFGGGNPKPSTPLRTLGLFGVRDTATMYATFYVAPKATEELIKHHGIERNTAELGCALAIPMITQIITAPVHIHAMDYYNNPNATWNQRIAALSSQFNSVAFARSFRILPAFGIGSFSNNHFREWFIQQEDENKLLKRRLTKFVEKRLTQRHRPQKDMEIGDGRQLTRNV